MTLSDLNIFLDCALKFLPEKMDTVEARAMLLAIALQESAITYRKQINGPGCGYWQFEKSGGVAGVLTHRATREICDKLIFRLDFGRLGPAPETVYVATVYNTALAAGLARLLLWTHPDALPETGDRLIAWEYYLECWRPGTPRPATWNENFHLAWGFYENDP